MQRLSLGAFRLLFGDGAGLHHRVQHQVAALDGALRMAEGIEVVRALDDARQHGALGQIELADILAEVGLRSLAEAIDREAAALAQVDLVCVHLEDLLLGEAMFELEGDEDLVSLRLMRRSGVRKKPRASCMVSVEPPSMLVVAESRSLTMRHHEAEVVDAAVFEESPVFNGQHSLHQVRRNLVVGEQAALGAIGVFAEAGDQQRLQLIAGERLPMVVGDGVDHAVADVDGGASSGVIGLRARDEP